MLFYQERIEHLPSYGISTVDAWPSGIVDQALIREPNLLVATLTQTLGVRELAARPLMEELLSFLRKKQFLLVLDH